MSSSLTCTLTMSESLEYSRKADIQDNLLYNYSALNLLSTLKPWLIQFYFRHLEINTHTTNSKLNYKMPRRGRAASPPPAAHASAPKPAAAPAPAPAAAPAAAPAPSAVAPVAAAPAAVAPMAAAPQQPGLMAQVPYSYKYKKNILGFTHSGCFLAGKFKSVTSPL